VSPRKPPVGASKRKRGRPSKRTPAVIERILAGLSEGVPLAELCRAEGMPNRRKVYEWMQVDPELSAHIARARDLGFDAIAEEALRIADTPHVGVRLEEGPGGAKRVIEDMVAHRRLQVETRLKLLAKWSPRRYGEQVDVLNDGEVTVRVIRERHGMTDGSAAAPTAYDERGDDLF
jgi:hypothetical protein